MIVEKGHLYAGTVLEEAERLEPKLLDIEIDALGAARAVRTTRLAELREQEGQDLAEPIDLTDLSNTRVKLYPIISPETLIECLPPSLRSAQTTRLGRRAVTNIIKHRDDRAIVGTGPCSIHNAEEALEYSEHVIKWRNKYSRWLEILMRAYFEKPRTVINEDNRWKGYTYDPYLDGSNKINRGIIATRLTARRITDRGVPIVVERLNSLTPQYLDSLVALDTKGARNVRNQNDWEYMAGTSAPGAFKNTISGDIQAPVNAVVSSRHPNTFIGMEPGGHIALAEADGNPDTFIILRGSDSGPNFSPDDIDIAVEKLHAAELDLSILVDTNHGQTAKDPDKQIEVVRVVSDQMALGNFALIGFLIESNLKAGRQPIGPISALEKGVSVTDKCSSIEETEEILETAAGGVSERRGMVKRKLISRV